MGEAKRRAANPPKVPDMEVASRVALAVGKIMRAASMNVGTDCMVHAQLATELLRQLGYDANIAAGEAAWRVGDGDGDVIRHGTFGEDMRIPEGHFPYHAWVETGDYILDVTMYQLVDKAEELDYQDGGHTTVEWRPDFLFVQKSESSNMGDVSQLHQGLFHYRKDPVILAKCRSIMEPLDQEHISAALIAYQHPGLNVVGPNHMP